jgi:hypothetical protein
MSSVPGATPTRSNRLCDERMAAACYVATLTAELVEIAKRHELDTLAYILDMARLEAENQTNPHRQHNQPS